MKLVAAVGVALAVAGSARADAIDDLFARYRPDTPGCAIGIARPGQPPILRGYGSADLEHAVPITPDTIFEAGSVSKQFTAAAILTLAADGKLALGDDIRKYLPEMPAYSAPITIDMLLSHTSGLRDWGEVEAIAGWPRGSRIYTHDEVLQVAARQKALNYAPGTAYSYTNTGYNLAAIIVRRVSGQSLADFTAERLFKPLGMTHSSWRDDFRRIVPGRAQAYERRGTTWLLDMPFENVHGNSSLLTTVGDLLIWNQALTDGKLGVVGRQLEQQAVLKDGRRIEYARGLIVTSYQGQREITHSGSTAGYRAWLERYPDAGLSVAVLCNAGNADIGTVARMAARPFAAWREAAPTATPVATPASELAARPGLYVTDGALAVLRIGADAGSLRLQGGPLLTPSADGRYRAGDSELAFQANGDLSRHTPDGETVLYRHQAAGWKPAPADVAAIVGTYVNEEADAQLVVTAKAGLFYVTPAFRPSEVTALNPLFPDAFARPGALMRVLRDRAGKVVGLRYQGGRVWDLRLRKTA